MQTILRKRQRRLTPRRKSTLPTREQLRSALTYDEATDKFYWIRNTKRRTRPRIAGYLKDDRWMIQYNKANYNVEDIKMIYFSPEPPSET